MNRPTVILALVAVWSCTVRSQGNQEAPADRLLLPPPSTGAESVERGVPRILYCMGNVRVGPVDTACRPGAPLEEGAVISTAANSRAEIRMDAVLVRLDWGTVLRIEQVMPGRFGLKLESGTVLMRVMPESTAEVVLDLYRPCHSDFPGSVSGEHKPRIIVCNSSRGYAQRDPRPI